MGQRTDYEELTAALRRCGSHWTSAQVHGLLCGNLAVAGAAGAQAWHGQVLDGVNSEDVSRSTCDALLDSLLQSTWRQLAERQSDFELLLPSDEEDASARAQAIADWCEGFLHGLVADAHGKTVKRRLASEPLSDLIRDMLEITRAAVGEEDDEEDNELAYAELVEYVRVAAQLAYEELADVRNGGEGNGIAQPVESPNGPLH